MTTADIPHDTQCSEHCTKVCSRPCKVDYLPEDQAHCYMCMQPGFYQLYQLDFNYYCAHCLHTVIGFEQCSGMTEVVNEDDDFGYFSRCLNFVFKTSTFVKTKRAFTGDVPVCKKVKFIE